MTMKLSLAGAACVAAIVAAGERLLLREQAGSSERARLLLASFLHVSC